MPERTRPSRGQTATDDALAVLNQLKDVVNQLDDALVNRVAMLEAEVEALKTQLATEVRTRRLVVVNGAGEERIVASTYAHVAEFMVGRVGEGDLSAHVRLEASDDDEDDHGAAIVLNAGGEARAFARVDGRDNEAWIEMHHPIEEGGVRLGYRGLTVD